MCSPSLGGSGLSFEGQGHAALGAEALDVRESLSGKLLDGGVQRVHFVPRAHVRVRMRR
jgi:hypothetical protein